MVERESQPRLGVVPLLVRAVQDDPARDAGRRRRAGRGPARRSCPGGALDSGRRLRNRPRGVAQRTVESAEQHQDDQAAASIASSQSSIRVPNTPRKRASHAGWAGHAGAVTRLPSTCASSTPMATYLPPAAVISGADRRVGRQRPAGHDARGRQDLDAVAEGRDRLLGGANSRTSASTFSSRRRYSGARPPGMTRAS